MMFRTRTLYILIVIWDGDEAHTQVFYSRNTAELWIKNLFNCEDMDWTQFQSWLAENKPGMIVHIQETGMEL